MSGDDRSGDPEDTDASDERVLRRPVRRVAARSEIADTPAEAMAGQGVEAILTQAERFIENLEPGTQRDSLERLREALHAEWRNPDWDVTTIERYTSRIARRVPDLPDPFDLDPDGIAGRLDGNGELRDELTGVLAGQDVGDLDGDLDRQQVEAAFDAFKDFSDRVDERLDAVAQTVEQADPDDVAAAKVDAEVADEVRAVRERIDEFADRQSRMGPVGAMMTSILGAAAFWWLTEAGGAGTIAIGLLRVLIGFYEIVPI